MLDILQKIAPSIAMAITGNIGGAVIEALKVFGMDSGTKEDLFLALKNATPEQLAALKQIDKEYAQKMKALGVDLKKIAAEDRDSARKLRIATGSYFTEIVGCMIIVGFFGVLYLIFKSPNVVNRALDIMLGSLGTMATAVVTFYFGSSVKKD